MDYRQLKLDKSKGQTVTDYENVPEQRGGWKPLIQPGDFLFRLPKNIDLAWAEPFEASVGDKEGLERVAIQFDDEHPLTIVKAPPARVQAEPDVIGQIIRARVTNAERNRARRGDPPAYVSDMYYLLFEGLSLNGTKPKDNMEWIKAMNGFAGKEFVAALAWSVYCNPKNVRRIDDGTGSSVEDPDKQRGCGARYYQSGIPRDEAGLYLENFPCGGKVQMEAGTVDCGAMLRCFGNLERFRPASFAEGW